MIRRRAHYSKTCVICSVVFEPRPEERTAAFKMRHTCSPKCAHAYREKLLGREGARFSANPSTVRGPRICACCGAEFHQRENESLTNYRQRLTCSPECRAERVRRKLAPAPESKTCICGAEFYRREGEPLYRWRERKNCSVKCSYIRSMPSRKNCLHCGTPVTTKGKYCSSRCATVHRHGDPDRLPQGFVERFARHNGMSVEGAALLLGVNV